VTQLRRAPEAGDMFSHMKQKMIGQRQVSTYLKYALGEVLLVMIGILLALQVNTCNENRKNFERENIILEELNNDFVQNLENFNRVKELQLRTFNNGQIFFRNIDKLHIPVSRDSVYKYASGMFGVYTYNPSNGVVESLISSGDIRFIRDDSLKKYLVSWNDVLTNYSERVAIEINFWSNQVEPYVIRNGDFYHIDSDKNIKLVEDQVFINMLVRQHHYNSNVISAIRDEDGIEFYMKEIVRLSNKNLK